jgi:DNA-directed RNA polymerase specialized sigma24 family protein
METITISDEIRALLDALPDKNERAGFPFTQEHDAILLNYWQTKSQKEIARIIGCSETSARRRYRLLTGGAP